MCANLIVPACMHQQTLFYARADEISTASGMAELSLLTSEALAYLHALSGDFSTEANYRANCVQASRVLQENSPGVPTDLTLFDSLHK